jgi:hypothetical protein
VKEVPNVEEIGESTSLEGGGRWIVPGVGITAEGRRCIDEIPFRISQEIAPAADRVGVADRPTVLVERSGVRLIVPVPIQVGVDVVADGRLAPVGDPPIRAGGLFGEAGAGLSAGLPPACA